MDVVSIGALTTLPLAFMILRRSRRGRSIEYEQRDRARPHQSNHRAPTLDLTGSKR